MTNLYIFSELHSDKFSPYSSTHFCVITMLAALTFRFASLKSWLQQNDKSFRYGSALFLIIVDVVYRYWALEKIVSYMDLVPLHFCDITYFITVYALVKNSKVAANIGLYWSILGSTLAIFSPSITYGPLHFRFFHYFGMHFIPMICNLHFWITGKISVSSKNNFSAICHANIVTFFIFIFDIILNQNWFYLMYCPIKSISDFLGSHLYSILWYILTNLSMRFIYLCLRNIKLNEIR